MNKLLCSLLCGLLVAAVVEGRVGCNLDPCDHICIDNVESYRCDCFENWVLQEDAHTCIHKRNAYYENMYVGCFAEDASNRDITFNAWDRTATSDASIENCVHTCRSHAFEFAALQAGGQCWCTNRYERIHGESTECTATCSGEKHQICGGSSANSVYKVTPDRRYMGCYEEVEGDPDLPTLMWERSEGRSPQQCILACAEAGLDFAGVSDGGRCSCGSSFGRHGVAPDNVCNTTCSQGWIEQNCGGLTTNAIYRVVRSTDISMSYGEPMKRGSFPASMMTDFPYTSGVVGDRIAIYASDVVQAPYEDSACANGNCYDLCGDIFVPAGIGNNVLNYTVRQFHIKLSEIPALIPTEETERLYVYAQTLVIDQSTTFDLSIYIRARQIIVNYAEDPMITFNHNGAILGYDVEDAVNRGPPSDLTFMKMSTACARMLLAGDSELQERLGMAILDDIARDTAYSTEHKTFMDAIRNIRTGYTGLVRFGINWAPYFTKSAFEDKLGDYVVQLGIYNDEFKAMMDDVTSCDNFEERAGSMIQIWTLTIVTQAELLATATYNTLSVSQEAYKLIHAEYNTSVAETEEARIMFEEGIERATTGIILKSLIGLTTSCFKMYKGFPPTGAAQTAADLVEASKELAGAMVGFAQAMETLAHAVDNMNAMLDMLDGMMQGLENLDGTFDWSQYDGAVSLVSSLYTAIVEWENIRIAVDVTLKDPTFRDISGCLEFRMSFISTCYYGEALTRGAIEVAENMRRAITASALYLNKFIMNQRYVEYFEEHSETCDQLAETTVYWAEQNYDIVIEMNNALLSTCQAYFYEELEWCPEPAWPNFLGSIEETLLRTLSAINALDSLGRSSKAVIDVDLEDLTTEEDCQDPVQCPIKIFKDKQYIMYNMPQSRIEFFDIDLLLVEELRFVFHGARSTAPEEDMTKQSLRIRIESTGPFVNWLDMENEVFMSRGMTDRQFQYNLNSGTIERSCDLIEPQGSKIQHMTPFTTWKLRLDNPGMEHIDLSDLTHITMTFIGNFGQG